MISAILSLQNRTSIAAFQTHLPKRREAVEAFMPTLAADVSP
jgi:hypothetical protein